MLKNACINPEIMKAISLCGHGDKILIADGNYPLDAESGDAADEAKDAESGDASEGVKDAGEAAEPEESAEPGDEAA